MIVHNSGVCCVYVADWVVGGPGVGGGGKVLGSFGLHRDKQAMKKMHAQSISSLSAAGSPPWKEVTLNLYNAPIGCAEPPAGGGAAFQSSGVAAVVALPG